MQQSWWPLLREERCDRQGWGGRRGRGASARNVSRPKQSAALFGSSIVRRREIEAACRGWGCHQSSPEVAPHHADDRGADQFGG